MKNFLEKAKQHKIISITTFLAVLVLIVIIVGLSTRPSAEDVINEFETALRQGDVDTIKKLIEPEDEEMTITDDSIQQLISYAKKDSDYFRGHIFLLNAQASIYEDGNTARAQNPFFDEYTEGEIKNLGDFHLKKGEGLFSSYKIYMRPYYLEVSTEEANASIQLKGAEEFTTDENNLKKTYGPLAPGVYTVTGSKEYEYTNVTTEEEVYLFDDEERQKSTTLDLAGEKITVESSIENVDIFVDGEKTDKKASVYEMKDTMLGSQKENDEENQFGPLPKNGSVKIHGEIEYPWGIGKSTPKVVDEDTDTIDVTPNPFATKKNQEKITKIINNYAKQRIEALVKQDSSILTTVSDNLSKEYTEDIENDKFVESTWEGKALGTRIDLDNTSLLKEGDNYQVVVPVELHNKVQEYNGFNDDDPLEEKFEDVYLTLNYDSEEGTWIISKTEPIYSNDDYMNGENIIKSEFK
ncbi:TcaA 3rd/4th domain-containing protein [Virgibacillus salexigens]|uniref:TcaA 3rd/4th domain-containing protein n=1 Tax=Virgibacillus massiliensis TaxID=1462526 RepID=UPI00136C8137|nr:hypothetical protein [Virgibacillus massiliensis]MYL43986.1 hypothetical protein [Virgibacillus massiliensis]